MTAEAEQGEGDQGIGGLKPEHDSGDQSDLGVGRLDQAVGQVRPPEQGARRSHSPTARSGAQSSVGSVMATQSGLSGRGAACFESHGDRTEPATDSRLIPSLVTYFFDTLATCIAPVRFAIPNSIKEQNVRVGSRHAVDLATYIKHEPSKTTGHHCSQSSNRP